MAPDGAGRKALQGEKCNRADQRCSENAAGDAVLGELPGRNISRLFSACELPLLRSVPQDGALQTDHGKQEDRSQIISKGGERIKALAAPTQSGDLAGYWTD